MILGPYNLSRIAVFLGVIFFLQTVSFGQDVSKALKYYNAKQYEFAATEFENAIPQYEQLYGDLDTVNLSKLVFFTAMSYDYIKDYKKAENYYLSCIDVYKRANYKNNTIYIQSNIYLGNIYYQSAVSAKNLNDRTKTFQLAENIYKEVENVYLTYFDKHHYTYAENCNNLAYLYDETGEYTKALKYYTETKTTIFKIYGKNHNTYATALNNLALFYLKLGNYKQVEPLYLESKNITEKNYGKNHISYALICNNLAGFYTDLGNYNKAKYLYSESHTIYKKNKDNFPKAYAQSCRNLAVFLEKAEEYEEIEKLLIISKDIYEKTFGKKSLEHAKSSLYLGIYYFRRGEYLKSINQVSTAKAITKKILGRNNSEYAGILNDAAQIHKMLGNYEEAESYFIESIKITEFLYGKTHDNYYKRCSNLGALFELIGKNDKAETYYSVGNRLLNQKTQESNFFLTEKEKEILFSKALQHYYYAYNSFYLIRQKGKKHSVGAAYNNTLYLKGQLLKSSASLRNIIINEGDKSLIGLYNQFTGLNEELGKQYTLPISERYPDLQEKEEKANTLEKELILKTNKLIGFERLTRTDKSWKNIRNSLKEDEAAIEFVSFDYRNKREWTDSILYFALVLKKDSDYPESIFLFEEKEIKHVLKRNASQSEYEHIKELYDPSSSKANKLYNLVWHSIDEYLGNIKNIYISPAGLLNNVSFDAIADKSGTLLSDKYKIIYTASTSEVAEFSRLYSKDINDVILFGGIDYGISPEEIKKQIKNIHYHRDRNSEEVLPNDFNNLKGGITWSYLPGSLEEIKKIDTILKAVKIESTIYSEKTALEEQFKNLQQNPPSILHISTHGFYFGDDQRSMLNKNLLDQDISFAYSDNPLLRSGFILTGGNTAFQGNQGPRDIEDGVLTALEISNLNFFKTKLVVLSACQTGLGEVKGSEGVYGLQRAFKMAGVDYLIFSLWEVPDEATKELMTKFYEFWFEGLEIRDAFKKAQDHLKVKYKNIPGSAFAWAAFILMK